MCVCVCVCVRCGRALHTWTSVYHFEMRPVRTPASFLSFLSTRVHTALSASLWKQPDTGLVTLVWFPSSSGLQTHASLTISASGSSALVTQRFLEIVL